jgi:hypothetical protein
MSSQLSQQQSGPRDVHSTYTHSKPEMNNKPAKRAKTSHQNTSILPLTSSNTNIPPSFGPLSILPVSNPQQQSQQTEHLTQGMPQQQSQQTEHLTQGMPQQNHHQ